MSRTDTRMRARGERGVEGRRKRQPLSDEVRDLIMTDFVAASDRPAESRFPTEAELCDLYGVSRITVRSALRSLHAAGLVTVRHGQGWALANRSDIITSGLDRLCSFERYAADGGKVVGTDRLKTELVEASDWQAEWLQIEAGDSLFRIERIKLFNKIPVAFMIDYVPTRFIAPEEIMENFAGSVLDVLANDPRIGLSHSDADISPVGLPADIAPILKVEAGTPSLFIDEVLIDSEDRIVEGGHAWLLPEHFRFRLRRRLTF